MLLLLVFPASVVKGYHINRASALVFKKQRMFSLVPLKENSVCHLKLQHFSFLIFKMKSFDALSSRVIPSPNGADSGVGYTVLYVALP